VNPPADASAAPLDLAQHARFVRRLAAGIVRDPEAADELAARTLFAAAQQPPARAIAGVGWFAVVARRLFARARRDERRRHARELAAAPREALPAADVIAAQVESSRRVGEAFARLPEPYRSTLFERYWLDLAPSAIAAKSGVPVATVKTRLQRGLEALRAELLTHGDRDTQLARLRALAMAHGSLWMTTKSKAVAAAAAVVLLAGALGVARLLAPPDRDDGGAPLPFPPPVAAAERPLDAPVPDLAPATRVDEPRRDDALPFAGGIVVDETGAPIDGVEVVAGEFDREEEEQELLLPLCFADISSLLVARSGHDGRFVVPRPTRDLATLLFVKEGFALGEVAELAEAARERQELRVVLRPGRTHAVEVVDGGGAPLAAAVVEMSAVRDAEQEQWHAATAAALPGRPAYWRDGGPLAQVAAADADGHARFASLPRGPWKVRAFAEGCLFDSRLVEDGAATTRITLRRCSILVDVVDAVDGAPLDGACLLLLDPADGRRTAEIRPQRPTTMGRPWRATCLPGRLALHESLPGIAPQPDGRLGADLWITAPGHVAQLVPLRFEPGSEPPALSVALERGDGEVALAGRVRGATSATLRVVAADRDPVAIGDAPLARVEPDEDGRFAIHGLPPGDYRLLVDAPRCGSIDVAVRAPARDLALELVEEATVELLVVDGDGKPAANAVAQLQDRDERHAWRKRSDAEGRARFDHLTPGEYVVAAFPRIRTNRTEVAPRVLPTDAFAAGATRTLAAGDTARIEVALLRRQPLTIRVAGRTAGAPCELRVALGGGAAAHCESLDLFGRGRALALDDDGAATVLLLPGEWNVTLAAGGIEQARHVTLASTRGADLLFVLPSAVGRGRLRGRVVGWNDGAPIEEARVVVQWSKEGGAAGQLAELVTDADGRFELADAPPGRLFVDVSDLRFDRFEKRRAEQRGRMNATDAAASGPRFGDSRDERTLARDETAEIVVRVVPGSAPPEGAPRVALDLVVREAATGVAIAGCDVHVAAMGPEGARAEAGRFVADAEGRVAAELWPAARYEIALFSPRHPAKWLQVAPVDGLLTVDAVLAAPTGR